MQTTLSVAVHSLTDFPVINTHATKQKAKDFLQQDQMGSCRFSYVVVLTPTGKSYTWVRRPSGAQTGDQNWPT